MLYISEPPYFIVRPKSAYNLKVGDSITMPCSAASNRIDQPPISWRKVSRRENCNMLMTDWGIRDKLCIFCFVIHLWIHVVIEYQ